jgi:hypothetical protein
MVLHLMSGPQTELKDTAIMVFKYLFKIFYSYLYNVQGVTV